MRERLTAIVASKTRAEWVEVMEGTDACFAPILPMSEAKAHPHVATRRTIVEHDGMDQPAPAPRFSRTPSEIQGPAALPGQDTEAVLADWGFADDEVAALLASGAVTHRGLSPRTRLQYRRRIRSSGQMNRRKFRRGVPITRRTG